MKSFLVCSSILFLLATKLEAEITTLNGSVFVVMKSGDNVKLALAPVYIISEPQFREICAQVKPEINTKIQEYAKRYLAAELRKDYDAQLALLGFQRDLKEEKYFAAFPPSVTKSDADGKFTLTFSDSEPKIIALKSQRRVGEKTEHYFWAFKFQPTGKVETILFSNDNMTEEYNILDSGELSFIDEVSRIKAERIRAINGIIAKQTEEQRLAQADRAAKAKTKALQLNIEQAEKGDAYGQYRMGLRYLKGEGVEKDAKKAREWLTKAAAQNHSDAKSELEKMK